MGPHADGGGVETPNFALASPSPGRAIRLSPARRAVIDLLRIAKTIPTVPVQREINLGALVMLRETLTERIGWCAIFTKAFALAARSMPELRRSYLKYPTARLYEHPVSVASVAVEREHQGEAGVFFARLPQPENETLANIEAQLKWHKQAQLEAAFSTPLLFFRVPGPLRRGLWWWIMNVRGSKKSQFLGTFGVSVYSSLGAESLHPLGPQTILLNYGVIRDGKITLRLVYDHRVMDGATIARALAKIETVLHTEIRDELLSMRQHDHLAKAA